MSGVLTMKAGAKRPFDAMDISTSAPSPPFGCSPHAVQHASHRPGPGSPVPFPGSTTHSKRSRTAAAAGRPISMASAPFPPPGPGAADDPQLLAAAGNSSRPLADHRKKEPRVSAEEQSAASPFDEDSDDGHPSSADVTRDQPSPEENEMLGRAVDKHIPKRIRRALANLPRDDAAQRRLFSLTDVRKVVQSVSAEREQQMREEFTRALQHKLSEQYLSFAKFNEDHISRQLKQRDFSYLS